jgi:hypothetical protein
VDRGEREREREGNGKSSERQRGGVDMNPDEREKGRMGECHVMKRG